MSKRHHHRRMAGEIAEASRRARPTGRGYPSALIDTARALERLRAKARKLRRELKLVEGQIKHEKKMLKAMAGAEEVTS